MRLTLLLGSALVVLALAGCGGSTETNVGAGSATPGEVIELTSLKTLTDAFAAGEGHPRVLVLLSPT
jgi:hypothetical protein